MPEQSQKERSLYDGQGLTADGKLADSNWNGAGLSAAQAAKLQNLAGQAATGRQAPPSVGRLLDREIEITERKLEDLRRARTLLDLTPGSEMLLELLEKARAIHVHNR